MTSAERALAVRAAFQSKAIGHVVRRGRQSLVFDELPTPVLDKDGLVIGVSVMVRLFEDATEIPIDPHRVIVNPPTVPRANQTYVDDPSGEVDKHGLPVQKRVVGLPNPEAALIEALWDSIDLTPNAKGWRTRGTVTTVFATPPGGNGNVRSEHATTYATARTGNSLFASGHHSVGQNLSPYQCFESFLIFDTSGIPDADTVSAVVLSLDGNTDNSTTDFTAGAAASAYDGGSVVTADWVSGASIPTPELATWNSSGYSAGYNAFTETADFKTAINKTGNTSLILYSQEHRDNSAPTAQELVSFIFADAAGTTTDPKLDITHAGASAAITGTAQPSITEADVVTGGKTIIITLTGDTWVASGATFDGQRDEIIAGLDSAQSEATGWDAVVKAGQTVGGVARTSDTVVTVTLDAFATYDITATETITVTVPGTAVTGASPITATPTFTVTAVGGATLRRYTLTTLGIG